MVFPKHRSLALKAINRTPHIRLVQQHGCVVDHVTSSKVVGAVHDQVVLGKDFQHVGVVQALVVHHNVDVRVDFIDRVASRFSLRAADVALAVNDLALQVRFINLVELDDAQGAHASCG